jgi:hypothetical protein
MIDPEVMQATRDFHHEIIIVLAQVAKDIMDDTKHLNPTETMLNTNTVFGNGGINQPFCGRQVMSFGFLGRLKGLNVSGFIALKAGIFPQLAAGREDPLLVIGQLLVMTLALHRWAETLNLASTFVTRTLFLRV